MGGAVSSSRHNRATLRHTRGMKRFRDEAMPYALFALGMVVAEIYILEWMFTPIHEMGHVLASWGTGGYGAWNVAEWNEAMVYGGNRVIILAAGVFFELIFGTAMAAVLVVFRKATWLGGALFANGIDAAWWAHNQHDWSVMRKSYADTEPVVTTTLDVMMVVCALIVAGALALSIAKRKHYLTNYTPVH